uniref:Uncharacterized protein n=1 Tax=Ananas comosus var. bracteatus TaxID=296719 RepID=A0A6V7NPH4_ANACO|nr:unnamed protein product [Ananas comosus var. bracteatus]
MRHRHPSPRALIFASGDGSRWLSQQPRVRMRTVNSGADDSVRIFNKLTKIPLLFFLSPFFFLSFFFSLSASAPSPSSPSAATAAPTASATRRWWPWPSAAPSAASSPSPPSPSAPSILVVVRRCPLLEELSFKRLRASTPRSFSSTKTMTPATMQPHPRSDPSGGE